MKENFENTSLSDHYKFKNLGMVEKLVERSGGNQNLIKIKREQTKEKILRRSFLIEKDIRRKKNIKF